MTANLDELQALIDRLRDERWWGTEAAENVEALRDELIALRRQVEADKPALVACKAQFESYASNPSAWPAYQAICAALQSYEQARGDHE